MLRNLRQISILNKIFNVRGNEWSRISFVWVISFLYRVGFVIGWTVLVALFVTRYGIASLPYLFVLNAVFSIIGSLVYSIFVDRYKKSHLMVFTIFASCAVLFGAFFFGQFNQILFFALLIVAESIFLNQFRIILTGFMEDMFTPIQSERAFPLIESSDTIGGISAGLLVVFISQSINPASFILIWIAVLLLIVPLLFGSKEINHKISKISKKTKELDHQTVFTNLKNELKSGKHYAYIKGIFLIVFFQWFLFNLLEFQYTKAVYQNVSNVILDAGSGFEHSFVHDLGQLFILFSGSALIIQLFVGSRLINALGVIGSMLLHPIVTLLSILGLTGSFTFRNAVLAKNNFTITTVIHKNAYHSSFYAVGEKSRSQVRELLEGIVRPIGAVFGTAVLLILQYFFYSNDLILYVNISMLAVSIGLMYVTYLQQQRYTDVAIDDFQNSTDKHTRFNAIEILSQKGTKYPISILLDVLKDKKEPISVRVKVLRSLAILKKIEAIPTLIDLIKSNSLPVRRATIDSLLAYDLITTNSKQNIVVEHKLLDSLEKAYKSETNPEIRTKILTLLSRVSTVTTFDFLLHLLKKSKAPLRADIIYALGNYPDSLVVDYLRPFLKSRDRRERTSALISIGRFPEFAEEVKSMVHKLLHSNFKVDKVDALYIIGELKLSAFKSLVPEYLKSRNQSLKLHAAIALAKFNKVDSVKPIIDILVHGSNKYAEECRHLLENVDVRIYRNVDKIIKHLVVHEVDQILTDTEIVTYHKLSKAELHRLKWLYSLVEEYDEVDLINKFLTSK